MIYTITLNPSLDYLLDTKKIELGKINRSIKEEIYVGGKGINVSRVLSNLEVETTALGFIAGFTGKELESRLKNNYINTDFILVENGITRINVKIKGEKETAINANGPSITTRDIDELLKQIEKITNNDLVIIAGNTPKSIDSTIYEKICSILSKNNIKFIVDATSNNLMNILKYHPFLIKPNQEELEESLNVKIKSLKDLRKSSDLLKEMGATNILVSLGKNGAILFDENNNEYSMNAPVIDVKNTVGAGDSMVAGFIYGYNETNDYKTALKYGIACGSATAACNDLATKEEVKKLFEKLN